MRWILPFLFSLACAGAWAQVKFPDKPASGYVADTANLLKPETVTKINTLAEGTKKATQAPIVVVTIPSLASVGAGDMTIESYATDLFNHWGIGWPQVNRGVLLLVSKADRKARLEFGADWGHTRDGEAQVVTSQDIIPYFKKGDFDGGILAGARGMDSMMRSNIPVQTGGSAPTASSPSPYSGTFPPMSAPSMPNVFNGVGFCFMPILILLAIIRSLMGGLGGCMGGGGRYYGGGLFGGGGGYSGGGFSGGGGGFSAGGGFSGGGSSGGGGASGSW